MSRQILVTGGAGFVGSHLCDQLLAAGHRVRVLDNLSEQVHGPDREVPSYLDPQVELQVGDVCDPAACRKALRDVEVVFHLAARVGVGQSMYELARYTEVNNLGTATLLEEVVASKKVQHLAVASSMSVYGEGLYRDRRGQLVSEAERSPQAIRQGRWELLDGEGAPLEPVPTPESKRPSLASVYALSKYDQERLCLMVGAAYGIPTVALRLFNIYGPRQALSNPYTGVLAIFAARLLNDRPPLINEDGEQRRDFVSVHDVAAAFVQTMKVPAAQGQVLNVGSGQAYTIRQIALEVGRAMRRPDLPPTITGQYRAGDIRHCYADISLARRVLGWQPRLSLSEGLAELGAWLRGRRAVDRVEAAREELSARGLAI